MDIARFKTLTRAVTAPARRGIRLRALSGFGSNPGTLNAWFYAPETRTSDIPLVVVLHGCTQTAAAYDAGSGWSQLAETHGFAVLYPEQQRANNASLCFNWFELNDTRRGGGEALSIAQMIEAMIERHGVDRERVFITGLSAGGAMTSAMLASYPEKFAGAAILAGLPYGAATSVPEALQQMHAHTASPRTSGGSIKRASGHDGPWPTVSIWHGTADAVVAPSNADAIVRQWLEVHELPQTPSETGFVDRHPHRVWRNEAGRILVEEYRIAGMGHGTPLATHGECGCGEAGAFMLEVGISSTLDSARRWGLIDPTAAARATAEARPPEPADAPSSDHVRAGGPDQPHTGIGQVIERALRSAGLMK